MDKDTLTLLLVAAAAYLVWQSSQEKKDERVIYVGGPAQPPVQPPAKDNGGWADIIGGVIQIGGQLVDLWTQPNASPPPAVPGGYHQLPDPDDAWSEWDA